MPSKEKRKGNAYEAELRDSVNNDERFSKDLHAIRAWGSDGRSLGFHEEVDLVIEDGHQRKHTVQAKRRKKIAKFLKPTDNVDVVAFREDRGETYVLMTWDMYLGLIR